MKSPGRNQSAQEEQAYEYIEEPVRTVVGEVFMKRYLKLKVVGSGSYSKCYLVKNADSESTYVVKVIPKKKLEILQREKLYYEIKIQKLLSHENVVYLDHWYEDEVNQYIFMEYCSKGNLETALQKEGKMDEKMIKKYGEQVVKGIQYIHSQNVLHRDLKLCNFYLDENDNVKLGDFGFACQLASEYDRKRETCGTPNYIAPEVFSGFGYSYSSDVWSIGVILYRLKYGCCPFEGQSVKATLQNVKLCNYKFPKTPKISPLLKDLIQKIFTLNYDDRLTTQQILAHKFFQNEQAKSSEGFSFTAMFKSKSTKTVEQEEPTDRRDSSRRKNMMERTSNNAELNLKEKQGLSKNKKYNSCEALKNIREIFKSKSKNNLNQTTNSSNSHGLTHHYSVSMQNIPLQSGRDRRNHKTMYPNETLASIDFMDNGLVPLTSKQDEKEVNRVKRLSEFIKKQANTLTFKEEMKKQKETSMKDTSAKLIIRGQPKVPTVPTVKDEKASSQYSPQQQILFNASSRYFLPQKIQQEKDMVIIHYKTSVKQVICSGTSFIVHRAPLNMFSLTGEPMTSDSLSKVQKFILENKVAISQREDDEEEMGELRIPKIILCIPHSWVQAKEGIILKYGRNESLVVSKLMAQECFHIWDSSKTGNASMCMYSWQESIKLFEGIVIMRIYSGWVKSMVKV